MPHVLTVAARLADDLADLLAHLGQQRGEGLQRRWEDGWLRG